MEFIFNFLLHRTFCKWWNDFRFFSTKFFFVEHRTLLLSLLLPIERFLNNWKWIALTTRQYRNSTRSTTMHTQAHIHSYMYGHAFAREHVCVCVCVCLHVLWALIYTAPLLYRTSYAYTAHSYILYTILYYWDGNTSLYSLHSVPSREKIRSFSFSLVHSSRAYWTCMRGGWTIRVYVCRVLSLHFQYIKYQECVFQIVLLHCICHGILHQRATIWSELVRWL